MCVLRTRFTVGSVVSLERALDHVWAGRATRSRPGGETGRRKGLKTPRRKPCRFESGPGHQLKESPNAFSRSRALVFDPFLTHADCGELGDRGLKVVVEEMRVMLRRDLRRRVAEEILRGLERSGLLHDPRAERAA